MKIILQHPNGSHYQIDRTKALNISIPLKEGLETVNAFHAPPLHIEPVRAGNFVGDMQEGGLLNFKNVQFNPHGNGTHTECVGHISPDGYTLNQCLKQFFFWAELVSIYPQKMPNGDRVITQLQIEESLKNKNPEALLIRTMPNDELKLRTHYSGANPPYLHHTATEYIVQQGIQHLLLDLPSVDREQDEGKLLSHKTFWQYPSHPRLQSTITELIYVDNTIKDGSYLLNLMVTSLELDASPSKPILYALNKV